MRTFLIASAILLAPAPAGAAGKVSLQPGEQATVLIDDGGLVSARPGGRATLSPFDKAAIVDLVVNHPDAYGPKSHRFTDDQPMPPAPTIEPGAIRISFHTMPSVEKGGEARVLVIENGYDRGLRYRATISRDGRSQPTDVCRVMPERRSYEHWPYAIDRIELTALTLVPLGPNDPVICE